MSLAEQSHVHGWCRECRARRASRDSGCPVCFGLLEDVARYEPHDSVEPPKAEVPETGLHMGTQESDFVGGSPV